MGLGPKMSFYLEHSLELRDGLIIQPPYLHQHWMHSLRIPLRQLRVGSHHFRVETDQHIPWWTKFDKYAIFRGRRLSGTLYSDAQCTMRSEDICNVSTRIPRAPSLHFFGTKTRDASPFLLRRYLLTNLNSCTL